MRRAVAVLAGGLLLIVPLTAMGFPFGGQANLVVPCYNQAIYASLGGPIGGPYIWLPGTKTYQFGPPKNAGQWLLGLASVPYYCVVSIEPIIVWPGTAIDMMGSSGPSAARLGSQAGPPPGTNPLTGGGGSGSGGGTGAGSGGGGTVGGGTGGTTGIGHIVVSEVYYRPDSAHGGTAPFQWVELYNGAPSTVDISGWGLRTASSVQTIPSGTTLGAGQYLLISGTTTVRTAWSIPSSIPIIVFPNAFGGGLAVNGDAITLQDTSNANIDAMSWGSNSTGFSPPAPVVGVGHSIIRHTLASDSDTASDWVDVSAPSPGK